MARKRRARKPKKLALEEKQAKADAEAAQAAINKVLGKQKRRSRPSGEKRGKKLQSKTTTVTLNKGPKGPRVRGQGGRRSNQQSRRASQRSSRGSARQSTLSEITRSADEPVLFVGNIPHECNRNMVIKTFAKYADDGKIRACKMPTAYMPHLGMRHHRGFAFIVFKNQVDLACCLDLHQTDHITIEGFEEHPLECKPANQETDMPDIEAKRAADERRNSQVDQLFVGALPWTANEQDLREFFELHGEIEQLFLPRWPTNPKTGLQKHKGYAFVRFTPKSFKKARKLAQSKESFLPRFPNIPIKVNIAKGTEPNMPRSNASYREKMKHMYNPYNHPAGHIYPSPLPMDVYKQAYGNRPAPSMYDARSSALKPIAM